jgi:hypothetical protein
MVWNINWVVQGHLGTAHLGSGLDEDGLYVLDAGLTELLPKSKARKCRNDDKNASFPIHTLFGNVVRGWEMQPMTQKHQLGQVDVPLQELASCYF